LSSSRAIPLSQLSNQLQELVSSHYPDTIAVSGEVSGRIVRSKRNHLYFHLQEGEASMQVVFFNAPKLTLQEGDRVVVHGRVGYYQARGSCQLIASQIVSHGIGEAYAKLEKLKQHLEAQGLLHRKRPLPRFIRSLALVTSKKGAALADMVTIASKRFPLVKLYLVDTLVQGDGAPEEIARAIAVADGLGVDAIVLARGGGSRLDLAAFDDERVLEAILRARTPIVSAIGHASDTSLSDLVADATAPTPSGAMELLLPEIEEFLETISVTKRTLTQQIQQRIYLAGEEVARIATGLERLHPRRQLEQKGEEIPQIGVRLHRRMEALLQERRARLTQMEQALKRAWEARQREAARCIQLFKENHPVTLSQLAPGDRVELRGQGRVLYAVITDAP